MSIIIVSGPVIIEKGKVLLNKHGDTNFWKFPGGRIEDFSQLSLEEHAKREVMEEMGIGIDIIRPLSTMMTKKGDDVVVLVHFLAKRIGKVFPGPDIREWKWVPIKDLPDDCAPNIKPIVEEAKKLM
ncbi:MAG: NUDIX domain-containing protein [Parcubacteria group bacterium]